LLYYIWYAKVLITVTLRPASAKTKPYVKNSSQPKKVLGKEEITAKLKSKNLG
jgi:hypothetical protein